MIIGPGSEVTLHFSLALESGEIVDTTLQKTPGTFVVGDETLPSGYEKLLHGLKAGDRRSFLVGPEQGFGEHRKENVQRFKAEKLMPMVDGPLENGITIVFEDASGHSVSGVVSGVEDPKSLDADTLVSVDFNHPLAGRQLHFSVEIIDVKAAAQAVKLQDPSR